jgi:ankyrin repeat protein
MNKSDSGIVAAARSCQPDLLASLLMRDSRAFDESSFRAERSAALCAAARSGHIDCVQALLCFSDASLANRAVNGTTPLVAAVRSKRCDVVRALLGAGAAVDTRAGETPLTAAIWHRSDAIVQLLLELGADVERTNSFDQAPLWVAVQCKNAHAAQTLLDCGASANCAAKVQDVAGMTALQTAVLNGSADFAHLLLRAGALVDATNDNRQTALQIAVESGSVEMVRLLILANANVQQHSDVVSKALCLRGITRIAIATLLLAAGAPVDAIVIPLHVHLESEISALLVAAGAVAVTAEPDAVVSARRNIITVRKALVRERIVEICIGLQPFDVPALQLLMIVDESLFCAALVTMYDKWQLIAAIKHFNDRRVA